MLHALIAGLFVASSYAHERGQSRSNGGSYSGKTRSSLVADATSCYTDADCENNEVCNGGACETEATICYGDDECRGRQVCDMGSYICVDPTPSPIWTTPSPTDAPGCCYNPDSYKGNDRCAAATDAQRCEDMGCTFLITNDPEDCRMTTTTTTSTTTTSSTTTTPAPGCCYGDSYKSNGKCNKAGDEDRCISNGCFWRETDDPEDCVMTTTSTTTTSSPEGCCYGEGVKENEMCANRDTESQCERSGTCEWREGENADCTYTPTTTTERVGCCKGLTARNADMCADKDADMCDRSAKCEFIEGGEPEDCLYTTTTSTSEAPGCCYGDGYKSNDRCLKAQDESRCLSNGCNWMETEDPTDCEMTTSTTTTTTEAPGCCRAIPTMATISHNENCLKRDSEGLCARGSACEWIVTDNDDDCLFTTTTTTTTTEEPGCCKGDSVKSNPMCNARSDSKSKCERSSSCHFVVGGDIDVECAVDSTTIVPGCCYANPDVAYSKKYQTTCTAFFTERDCLKLTDSDGNPRCAFEELIEGYDCSLLWPTTTTTTDEPGCCKGSSVKNQAKCLGFDNRDDCERRGCEFVSGGEPEDCVITTTNTPTTTEEVGCCKGDSAKSNPMCNARTSRTQCERSSSCHFIVDGDVDVDCAVDSTTIEPGCCYINPDVAYSKRYQTMCTAFFTERDCTKQTDGNGVSICVFEPLGEYMDCEMLWPTTTTTTEEPGCCRGFSYKAQAKCVGLMDEDMCDRKGCEWVFTEDFSECELTTTTTTSTTEYIEPGCCKGDSARTNDRCNKMETRDKCERSSSCHFISGGEVDVDCVVDTTTTEPGCCYGNPDAAYSKRWMDSCTAFYTERDCLLLTNGDGEPRCAWEALGEGYDCEQLWPTTTTTTEEPGCCRGFSYKAQAKCVGLGDQIACERKDCEWIITDDFTDCELTTTTTTTTTTTPAPGCCKADSARHQGMCDMKDTESKCDRSSSCHWVVSDDPMACVVLQTTTQEPGCCYGNPDVAYSARWMESCKTFFTQRDCEMLTNGDGDARCVWEALGDGYDCAQLWPTTTTTTVEPGCCYGDSAASNAMCAAFDEDPDKCDARGQCVFRAGEDADCEFVPTTTTEEVGCCRALERKNAENCLAKEGRSQCERSGNCEFIETDDDSDCEYDTTTSEPWLNAKSETNSYSSRRSSSNRRGRNSNAQEAMLFGGADSAVANAMQTQISLSTVLIFVLAAFALHQAYACVRNNGGYKQIQTSGAAAYQTV